MRSARIVLATAAASAVLAITAPGAYAADGDDWDHGKSSYSKEHDKDSSHDAPHGGIHTGGGALTAAGGDDWATAKDPKHDPETYKDHGQGKDTWSSDHEKPSGGMHTGGGGLASPGVTTGGLAVLAVAATGVYALRRNKTAGSVA